MKFKNLLTKALLVTAGLCMGASAWAAKSVVGSLDNSTNWWSAFSDYYTLEANESQTVTFTNYSSKGFTYHNWLLVVTNDVDRGGDGYSEYFVLRADGHKWGDAVAAGTYTCSEGIGMPCDNAAGTDAGHIGYTTLMDILDGSNVVLKVSRSGATVTIRADFTTSSGTSYYQQEVITAGDGTQNIRFFLTTEKGHIENLYNGAWNCIETRDFDDAETFKTGFGAAKGLDWAGTWSTTGTSVAPTQIARGTGYGMYCQGNTKRTTDVYYQLSNSSFSSAIGWKVEMDFAFQASSSNGPNELCFYNSYTYGNHSSGRMTGKTNYFMLEQPNNNTNITLYKGSDKTNAVATTLTGDSYQKGAAVSLANWYHLIVKGIPNDGMYVEIHNANGETVIAATKVNDYVIPGGFNIALGQNYGRVALDNLKLYTMIQPQVTTKYELSNGTTLISSVVEAVQAGTSYTPPYPTSFQSGTKQYTYVSGGETIASVTADMERTIIYSEEDMPTGTFYAETYEKNGGTTGWSTGTGGRYTPVVLGNETNKYLSVNQSERNNNGANVSGNAWDGVVEENTDFTMSFDLQIDAANENTSPLTFNDYDNANAMLKIEATGNDGTTWKINDNADQTITLSINTWYTFTYSRKGSLTYLTVTQTSDDTEILSQTQITTVSADGGIGKLVFSTGRYYANIALDNVLIRAWQTGDTPEVTETTYTIQYRDEEGNEIKDDVVNPTTVGTEGIVASSAETASFYNNDRSKKYIYKSGNNPITATATAASNVITLVFREAATYHYTVTNNLGTELSNTTAFEQDEIVQPYPRYELKDGKMYTKGATANEYRVRFTLAEDNQEETITGYADANIAGVVFYTEGENITGATVATEGTKSSRSSNGAVGQNPESAELTVLEGLAPGTYKICATFIKDNKNGVTATFKVGEASYSATNSSDITNMASAETDEFTITETSDVIWTNNCNLDYVYIQKTKVSKTITSAGWATYCSPYALDFTGDIDNLTEVYIVTDGSGSSDNGVLTKTSVKGYTVPANTGLLMRGTTGSQVTVTIPVAASGEVSAVEGNKLKGVTTDTSIEAGKGFVLMNDATRGVAFYKNKNSFTVGANTAYLPSDFVSSGARITYFSFDDESETTGIDAIVKASAETENYYNLNGQRVMNPSRGLYIKNGKKVIK